jgi:beta-ribofuranosylaminobenzene 5'-phosphate synthase
MIIVAKPRIHMTLADMGSVSPRSFGGVGFSIDRPCTKLRVTSASFNSLVGFHCLDDRTRLAVDVLIGRIAESLPELAYKVELLDSPPQHVGFGSQTSLLLAITTAIQSISNASWTRRRIQTLSGRGGASGVGIHAFFEGGVIWDGGHPRSGKGLMASGTGPPKELPPLMLRFEFPARWNVVLVVPDGKSISGTVEQQFFADNTPIPEDETYKTLATIYHGLLPAFRTANYMEMARALKELHTFGFKGRELEALHPNVQDAVRQLHALGFAAGVSSFGPLIYILRPVDNLSLSAIERRFADTTINLLEIVEGSNSAFEIEQ